MKSSPTALKLLSVVAIAGCAILTANAQNIVANPGFEASATFPPAWTLTETQPPGPPNLSNVGTNPSFAHSGNNHANLADDPGQSGSLTQLLSTSPGARYTFSFWLANDSNIPVNSFSASFGGSLVFATTSSTFGATGAYTQVTIANLLATTSSTLLSFNFRHDDDFWRLDDVSVVSTPEGGATLWLALPLFAGLCLLHLRSNRRSSSRS
jgi:hypothetical protein